MDLRDKLNAGLKEAMRDKDTLRLSTLRLINAAIKDQDIALRTEGRSVGEAEITAILAKMVKQRQESARAYEEAGRLELAEQEASEIKVIEEYLPKKLSDDEVEKAVSDAIEATGATSVKDMGKVMGVLKGKHPGQIDFGKVGPMVKQRLA